MKTQTPFSGRRNPNSCHRNPPENDVYSRWHESGKAGTAGRKLNSSQKQVAAASRNFFGCFSPPKTANSLRRLVDSNKSKASLVVSDDSRAVTPRGRASDGGINNNSNNSICRREPRIVKFTMEDIFQATSNFSPYFMIGQGGVGKVYKAKLQDGTVVAVKRANKSLHTENLGVEFQREIETLSQVEHLNLVKFYGYLEQGDERILVVEYVQNGTLREHLDCPHGNILDLAARLDIAVDVAHAITYLHMYTDHPIIHRDIKSSNILLTENLRAKVADFGFSRQAPDSDSSMTHISTQVKGTAGYLDPEYMTTYQLTEKSDVYSFGVLLVELVTGRRAIEPKLQAKERVTPKWAMNRFAEGDTISVLDPRLENSAANYNALEKILELALQCLAPHRQSRPNMKRCAEILWIIRKDYREISALDFRSFSSTSHRSS